LGKEFFKKRGNKKRVFLDGSGDVEGKGMSTGRG
jgi:hypothetical protein